MNTITISNYQETIKHIGLSKLNDGQKEAHQLILEASENFKNLERLKEFMKDEEIGSMITLYLSQLEIIAKNENNNRSGIGPHDNSAYGKARTSTVRKASSRDIGTTKSKSTSRGASKLNSYKRSNSGTKTKSIKKDRKKGESTFQKGAPQANKAPMVIKNINSPELTALLAIKSLGNKTKAYPDGKKPVKQIQSVLIRISNFDSAGLLQKHRTFIIDIATALKAAIKNINSNDLVKVQITSETIEKIKEALKDKKQVMQVNYLAGAENKKTVKRDNKQAKKLKSCDLREKEKSENSARAAVAPPKDGQDSPILDAKITKDGNSGLRGLEQDRPLSNLLKPSGAFVASNQASDSAEKVFRFLDSNLLTDFLGDMQRYRLAMMIQGPTHTGKSEIKNQIINGFAELGLNVADFDWEQGGLSSKDTLASYDRNIPAKNRPRIHTTDAIPSSLEELYKWIEPYDVIAMDSYNKFMDRTGLKGNSFDQLRLDRPDKIWIALFQLRDDGKTRGGSAPGYDAPIIIQTGNDGVNYTTAFSELKKNRGNGEKLGMKFYPASGKLVLPTTE